jgi:outer membrane protein OmpA-like peptidoglycan-associated protein
MREKLSILIAIAAIGAGSASCESADKRTAIGAGIGAAGGALAGAVIGHQFGNNKAGALIGGALGAGVGGLLGNRMDRQAKELEKIAETKRTDQGIVAKLKSDILFDSGKAELKPGASGNLEKMASILKKYPENVLAIKGYTDSTGSQAKNKELSEKRASSVRDTLVAAGVPPASVTAIGQGPANPLSDNKTREGRAQNRRVEIEIRADPGKAPKGEGAGA